LRFDTVESDINLTLDGSLLTLDRSLLTPIDVRLLRFDTDAFL